MQKYCCCQLTSAINARIFLGGGDISDDLFEELAELVCCKSGAAIRVEESYSQLNLVYKKGPLNLEWIKNHLPVEILYYDIKYGFHAVLVVKVDKDQLSIINGFTSTISWDWFLKNRPPKSNIHFRTCKSFEIECK